MSEILTDKHDRVVAYAEEELRMRGYHSLHYHKTGSAFMGSDNPGDYDVVVLLNKKTDLHRLARTMYENGGWVDCASDQASPEYEDETNTYYKTWVAIRKLDANIIITTDPAWYWRHLGAAFLCKYMDEKPLDKDHRIALFRLVRDGLEGW
ncbi:hypothetical protein [Xanthomonas phage SB3]|uniref:Nucleotidyltransferase n=1 Tax=Xanthomonas phage SB3 TaxID=3117472 RepID=A0ABZ2GUH1_9CAUD